MSEDKSTNPPLSCFLSPVIEKYGHDRITSTISIQRQSYIMTMCSKLKLFALQIWSETVTAAHILDRIFGAYWFKGSDKELPDEKRFFFALNNCDLSQFRPRPKNDVLPFPVALDVLVCTKDLWNRRLTRQSGLSSVLWNCKWKVTATQATVTSSRPATQRIWATVNGKRPRAIENHLSALFLQVLLG